MTRAIKHRNAGDALLAGLDRITAKREDKILASLQCENEPEPLPAPPEAPTMLSDPEKMSDTELDAELRSYGIDPEQLSKNMLTRLLKKKSEGFDTPLLNEMIRQFTGDL